MDDCNATLLNLHYNSQRIFCYSRDLTTKGRLVTDGAEEKEDAATKQGGAQEGDTSGHLRAREEVETKEPLEKKEETGEVKESGEKKEVSSASPAVQWATVVVSLLAAIFTGWNFYSTHELQVREADAKENFNRLNASVRQLEIQNQQDLDKAKLHIARFELLLKLKTEMLQGNDPKGQVYALNIAKLILSESDYSAFTSGLLATPDKQTPEFATAQTNLKEALKSASEAEERDVIRLIGLLGSSTREERLKAASGLIGKYDRNSIAVARAVDFLADQWKKSKDLKYSSSEWFVFANGRMNTLYFLNASNDTAWNSEIASAVSPTLQDMKRSSDADDRGVGDQTLSEIRKLEAKLKRINS